MRIFLIAPLLILVACGARNPELSGIQTQLKDQCILRLKDEWPVSQVAKTWKVKENKVYINLDYSPGKKDMNQGKGWVGECEIKEDKIDSAITINLDGTDMSIWIVGHGWTRSK